MCQAKIKTCFTHTLLLIPWLLIAFTIPLSLYPSIKQHKKEIYTLRSTLKKAITKSKSFKAMFNKAEAKVKDRLKLLKKTQKEMPIRESTKYGYQFSYYEDDIVLYQSDKGIGLKIKSKERLFKSKHSLSYTLEGYYKYKRFKSKEGEWVHQILTPEYAFWKKDNMYGFKKTTSDGGIIYKYYAKTKGRKALRHKVTLASKANYSINNEKQDSRYFYHFKDQQSITVRKGWSVTYRYSKTLGYTCWTDGNISLSPALAKVIYSHRDSSERKKYVKDILTDWPNTLFSQYLKILIKGKTNLSKPQDVYLTLINYTRKQYGLNSLKVSPTLSKICTLHGKYLLRHKPRNIHLQDRKKKGYFGKTPFQRRKKFKYPYRVSERILFGDNPIRNFVKVRRFRWKYEILDPRAVDFGLARCDFNKVGANGGFSIIMIGRKDLLPRTKPKILIYPSPRQKHIPPITLITKIEKMKGFGESPTVTWTSDDHLLGAVLVYDANIRIKQVQIKVNGKAIRIKKSQAREGVTSISIKPSLAPGETYTVAVSYQYRGKKKVLKAIFTMDSPYYLYTPF